MIEINTLRFRDLVIPALSLPAGTTAVIGPNGSGKTTFLRICAGIELPHHGTVSIDGAVPRGTETGWVNEFPDRNILFARVYDEIASPLRFRRDAMCDTIDAVVKACAESMHITHLLNREVRELSGGEKVLVSLAAALVHHPKVLLLDEYDSHLDTLLAEKVDQVIRASGARYVIRCTQQMNTAVKSDHLLFFDAGRVSHAGTPRDVFPFLKNTAFYPVLEECGL